MQAEIAAKDKEIAELKERLDMATRRLSALAMERHSLTASGLPPSDFEQKSGVERMAAGMTVPALPSTPFDARVSANANRIRAARLAN
jgi:hypothetical protein